MPRQAKFADLVLDAPALRGAFALLDGITSK